MFEGFAAEDFEAFDVPDFSGRMAQVRERIKPKLMAIGEAMPETLSKTLGEPIYPHVAQHLRRSVNPPVETWAAFAKEKRAYKPYVHFRVAISGDKVRAVVFVEDYAEEKTRFARNLACNAGTLAPYLAHHPTIRAYDICGDENQPLSGSHLTADVLRGFGERMKRVKGQHAAFGVQFNRDHPMLLSGPEFLIALGEAARILAPLYLCGSEDDYTFTYTPEGINI